MEREKKPDDGRNGYCTVYLKEQLCDCVMGVNLVNGKREGDAIIRHDNYRIWKLEYRNGELNGVVEKYNGIAS